MAIDNHFLLKKVLQKKQFIAAFCTFTNMPFVFCDPVTFEDQAWIFGDEEGFAEFTQRFAGKKIEFRKAVITKNMFSAYFTSLLAIGITEVVYTENGASAAIPLDQFVKKKDLSAIPELSRPLENPSLHLTALYLMQEVRRPVPFDEKENLNNLNEEFMINLARARFMMPIEVKNGPGTVQERIRKGQLGFVNLNLKNGDSFRPIFSDVYEFNKFKQKRNLQALTIPFSGLKQAMPKDVRGYLLNPAGGSVVISMAMIDQILARFPEEVKKGAEETRRMLGAAAAPIVKKPDVSMKNSGQQDTAAPDPAKPSQAKDHPKITQMPVKK